MQTTFDDPSEPDDDWWRAIFSESEYRAMSAMADSIIEAHDTNLEEMVTIETNVSGEELVAMIQALWAAYENDTPVDVSLVEGFLRSSCDAYIENTNVEADPTCSEAFGYFAFGAGSLSRGGSGASADQQDDDDDDEDESE